MLSSRTVALGSVVLSSVLFGWAGFAIAQQVRLGVPVQQPKTAVAPKSEASRAKAAITPTIGKRPPLQNIRPGWLTDLYVKKEFLARFDEAFQLLDKNKDGLLKWAVLDAQGKLHPDQAGEEPLPESYNACYLIDYAYRPAKTEKDPAHPGQYIETPAAYESIGWRTWKEVLAQLDSNGLPATAMPPVCRKSEKRCFCSNTAGRLVQYYCSLGAIPCSNPLTKDVCVDPPDVPSAFTKGAWVALAKNHFEREDWSHDGKLDETEALEFVCPGD